MKYYSSKQEIGSSKQNVYVGPIFLVFQLKALKQLYSKTSSLPKNSLKISTSKKTLNTYMVNEVKKNASNV